MKKCSVLLFIREMKMKTKIKFHLIPVRMAFTKKIKDNYWQGIGGKGTLVNY
jgi:hypothetical protein